MVDSAVVAGAGEAAAAVPGAAVKGLHEATDAGAAPGRPRRARSLCLSLLTGATKITPRCHSSLIPVHVLLVISALATVLRMRWQTARALVLPAQRRRRRRAAPRLRCWTASCCRSAWSTSRHRRLWHTCLQQARQLLQHLRCLYRMRVLFATRALPVVLHICRQHRAPGALHARQWRRRRAAPRLRCWTAR